MASVWQFTVASWMAANARDLARASRDAQAAAMGLELSEVDDYAFDAIADTINVMLASLMVDENWTVLLTAQAQAQDSGAFNVNFGFACTPPAPQEG